MVNSGKRMTSIAGLSITELEKLLSFLPRYRIGQIYKWITKNVFNFEDMTNIPIKLKNELSRDFNFFSSTIKNIEKDSQTKKIVILLKDHSTIEAVLLRDKKNRLTACLSTQAGCQCGCIFCKTGYLGFKRNLESYEITEQFFHLCALIKNENAKQSGKLSDKILIDNIVIMGMGEPLLNLDNLRKAINVFTDPKGLNISRRRITVSTCGIYDGLIDLAKNGPFVRLAFSLTAADENLRQKLMPIAKSNPLDKIKDTLIEYQKNSGARITLEIPLLAQKDRGGINTGEKDAVKIADFCKGLDTVINLIPWNYAPDLLYEGKPLCEPSKAEIESFKNMLEKHQLNVTMRMSKGGAVNGACGQLGSVI
ncbi:MAG: 23S rRNA (adenine(2503)-C(2))-methyltransferase RlmN [Treponema sp.]|nr:23S rRNA (adenine(2503)-C(2))-methyltransferase RlmN [Treponema sp.]